jgi:hypothetical protein
MYYGMGGVTGVQSCTTLLLYYRTLTELSHYSLSRLSYKCSTGIGLGVP